MKYFALLLILVPSLAFAGGSHDSNHQDYSKHDYQPEVKQECPTYPPNYVYDHSTTTVYVDKIVTVTAPPQIVYVYVPATSTCPLVKTLPPKVIYVQKACKVISQATTTPTTTYIKMNQVPDTGYEGNWKERLLNWLLK